MKPCILVSSRIRQQYAKFQVSGFGAMCVPVGYPIVILVTWLFQIGVVSGSLFVILRNNGAH